MTEYLKPSFTVAPGKSKAYRDNYEAAFGKKNGKTSKKSAKSKGQKGR